MFKKLDNVILCVNDMKESVRFYRDIIGLEQKANDPDWKTFSLGDTTLALRPWLPDTEDERHVKHGISLCFLVGDVNTAVPELESMGAHVLLSPCDAERGRVAEIADPDGYIIMLMTPFKWSLI